VTRVIAVAVTGGHPFQPGAMSLPLCPRSVEEELRRKVMQPFASVGSIWPHALPSVPSSLRIQEIPSETSTTPSTASFISSKNLTCLALHSFIATRTFSSENLIPGWSPATPIALRIAYAVLRESKSAPRRVAPQPSWIPLLHNDAPHDSA